MISIQHFVIKIKLYFGIAETTLFRIDLRYFTKLDIIRRRTVNYFSINEKMNIHYIYNNYFYNA